MSNVAKAIIGSHFSESDAFRFWSKVDIGGLDDCWPWKPPSHDRAGYGVFKFNGRQLRAHRVALALADGVAPAVFLTIHSCDNPPCCNPSHLSPATSKENTADMLTRGRARFTPCDSSKFNIGKWRASHLPFKGSSHPAAKLNEETVREIKLAIENGVSGVNCSIRFGCSVHTISNIKLGKQWTHV